jgi:hypothetical protein
MKAAGYELGTQAAVLGTVLALGSTLVASCGGGGGEANPNPPAPHAGEGVYEGRPSDCQLVLERHGNNFIGYARISNSIPPDSALEYYGVYHASGLEAPPKTPPQSVPIATRFTVPGTLNNRKLWVLRARANPPDTRVNTLCTSAFVED